MIDESSIINKIGNKFPFLTDSQKKVANFILKNQMQVAFSTIHETAQIVKVSTATVVRLALSLGYSGYAMLQKELQEYLNSTSSPSFKLEMNPNDTGKKNDIINNIVRQQLKNINTTYTNLSDSAILQAVKKISIAKRIYVFGQRSSYSVSHYLAYNINRILGNCDFIYNGCADIVEYLNRINAKDVVIAMSFPRYVKQVVQFTEMAHSRGAFVISICDGYLSPLLPFSDISFFSETASKAFHHAMTSSMFIADVIIGVLTSENRNRAKKNLVDNDSISRELQVFVK